MLAATPPMGWSTYYGLGANFDESVIMSVAESLTSTGLRKAGYNIVWFDWGWSPGRDASGNIEISASQWPSGLETVIDNLHEQGFLVGAYADAGETGGGGAGLGLYGHYNEDALQLADLGFDALKLDFVGAGEAGLNPRELYPQFAAALTSISPMILACCNFWRPGAIDGTKPPASWSCFQNYSWASEIAQSWRTDTDIGYRGVWWKNVLRNFDSNYTYRAAATRPGHWNDPDVLAPQLGMTDEHFQAQMSLWAVSSAPLIIGQDPRKLSKASLETLTKPKVIQIDQDPIGAPVVQLRSPSGHGEVYAKKLVNDARAVAFLNRSRKKMTIEASSTDLGLGRDHEWWFTDVWSEWEGRFESSFKAQVDASSVQLFLVWR